jgi:hypothetical protein
MFKVLQQLIHGGKKEEPDVKAETTMEKPTKEQIMDVYEKLRRGVYGFVDVTPSNEAAIEFLRANGFVDVHSEYFMDAHKGMIERRTARWIVGWDCSNCTEFFIADLKTKPSLAADEVVLRNVPQCRKGFSMEFRDGRKGKRCPYFEDKRLKEALAQWG